MSIFSFKKDLGFKITHKRRSIFLLFIQLFLFSGSLIADDVPLYKVFEIELTNDGSYNNKFSDVSLVADFTSPSGKNTAFWGFYDGDGNGGSEGNIWKLRFMPDEIGVWTYNYYWSDGTTGGSGNFDCIEEGRGKGIIQSYENNPRWFAYNGNEPVFLKSYYIYTGGALNQSCDWISANVYDTIVKKGYNHIQMNALPVAYVHQKFIDGPDVLNKNLVTTTTVSSSIQLDVWKVMEEHFEWFNSHDMGMHFFQGFSGKRDQGPEWDDMSSAEREFYVKYVCSRLAPYACICGWNFTWETEGDGFEPELMNYLDEYDPWDHLRTYHDESPDLNYYQQAGYSFAAIENHISGLDYKGSYSHYYSTLEAFSDKPVFMSEGNGLWRSYWNATETSIRRSAWGVTAAGGSFTWNDLPGDDNISDQLFSWKNAVSYLDILYDIMENEVVFYNLKPNSDVLSNSESTSYCLADPGKQYLVYEEAGGSFNLELQSGVYNVKWINLISGEKYDAGAINSNGTTESFTTPDIYSDWAVILRSSVSNNERLVHDFKSDAYLLYPNPVSDVLYLMNTHGNYEMIIYSLEGKQMITRLMNNENDIDLSFLPSGFYTAVFYTNEGIYQRKFIKK